MIALIVILFALWAVVRLAESPLWSDFCRIARSMSLTGRVVAVVCVLGFARIGGSKAPQPQPIRALSMLMHDPVMASLMPSGVAAPRSGSEALEASLSVAQADSATAAAASASAAGTAALVAAAIPLASALTLDLDWHPETRVPDAANIMAWEAWAQPVVVGGVLCEDHYVAFSATPTEAPGMVFDYADLTGERHAAQAFTNSFPTLYGVTLPSGVHSCYWFRCEVPAPFRTRLRTWNGEVRFGGPPGSAFGFDIAGILLIDDGNAIWRGLTTNIVFNGEALEHVNGILLNAPGVNAAAGENEL